MKRNTSTRALWVALTAAVSLIFGANAAIAAECNGPPEVTEITMMADWLPWASQGPMLAAQQSGLYKDQGLSVEMLAPANPADPIKLVAAGRVEFSLTYVPEILLANEAGIPIISVATTLRVLSSGLFFLGETPIAGPEDLKGKTLGVGPKQDAQAYLDSVLEAGGLTRDDVTVIDPGYSHGPMIISGKIDAAHGLTYSEGAVTNEEVLKQGKEPIQWLMYRDFGVPAFYYQVLAANKDWVAENPNTTCRFLLATRQGLERMLADPASVNAALSAANEQFTPEQHIKIYEGTANHWKVDGQVLEQDAGVWRTAAEWAVKRGLIEMAKDSSAYFTNEYIAK